jgi:heterotetrameric sarcosine oxidase delta subunit
MMQLPCPSCGIRDETEFTYGGAAHLVRPGVAVDDAGWAEFLYFRDNRKGVQAERWRHAGGCGQWFHAVRDTATHRILATYAASNAGPPRDLAGVST